MARLFFIITLMGMLTAVTACSPVTIRSDDQAKTYEAAHYQKTVSYWWWGLKGEHNINVREACRGLPVKQMQATSTFTDALAFIFTLGIYMPRTAKVWCDKSSIKTAKAGEL